MAVSEFLLEWFITSDYKANLNFEAKKQQVLELV